MNKKTAIKILETQKQKLDSFIKKSFYDLVWKTQTVQYIKQIFGENSEQFKFINGIKVQSPYSPDLTKFLDSCIDSVKNVGVFKEPKEKHFRWILKLEDNLYRNIHIYRRIYDLLLA